MHKLLQICLTWYSLIAIVPQLINDQIVGALSHLCKFSGGQYIEHNNMHTHLIGFHACLQFQACEVSERSIETVRFPWPHSH